ncbi:MAG: MBL fold metallo-hydrolase [Allosphingosinicella sp.]|uniref:MBL fold metallo-hydrolase n=1 Tax=Allosphingosinicella sp. TaxID=2823234 RepID=UPI0039607B84
MSLALTVHRGTQEIGGSCIELADSSGERIILDAGRPLDAPEGATGLLPQTLDRSRPATVIISHPHQDHWGLVEELPQDWPVWCGPHAASLIRVTGEVRRQPLDRELRSWEPRQGPMRIGAFTVTPILTDHSAFDAYMILIEAAGKRVLYTGDFRRHGRKSALVDRMMTDPPGKIDVLLMEGTNLRSSKPVKSETELEAEFLELFEGTPDRVFVSWSGQNIDRTVTLYRAAKRAGRTLVIDLYTADVLDRVAEGTGVPRPGFPNLKVVITRSLARNYRRQGRADFVDRMAAHAIPARALARDRHWVIMLRRALMRDYIDAGVQPSARDAYNFSMWRGYLDDAYHAEPHDWCGAAGARLAYIHTSGHASPDDLRRFAVAVAPKTLVPVHGVHWDDPGLEFSDVRRLGNGERWQIR